MKERWINVFVSASAALAAVAAVLAGLGAFLVLFENGPKEFATLASAAIIAAAIYFRKTPNTYNMTLGHPETAEIMDKLNALLKSGAMNR